MKTRLKLGSAALLLALASGAWAQGAKFSITGYQVDGVTLLSESVVAQIVAGFTGSERTLDDINGAAEALRKAYEEAGYPVVKVFPPQQAAVGGRVTLRVIEGEIKSVIVKGNQAYDQANIRASLPPLQEKTKPNARRIVAAIAAANENPAKQVAVNFQSAEALGNIDAVVTVTEDRPEKFTLSYDNMGSASTGVNRVSLGYQNANLLKLDHMLSVQFVTSTDYPSRTQSLSGGYRVPFYEHGLSLDLIAAISHSSTTTGYGVGSTQFNGQGYTFGARVSQSMPSAGEYRHRMIYGVDYKDFDNTCTGASAGTCGTATAQPVSATYFAAYNTPAMQLSAALAFAMNIRGGQHGTPSEYALARGGAKVDWNVWRLNSNLMVPLPEDFQFRAAFAAQYSNDRLLPGEQFGLGGASSVRGYVERTVSGDSGYSASVELYSPDFGKLLSPTVNARALVFSDWGQVQFVDGDLYGEKKRSLASIGAGLRLNLSRDLVIKFDLGFVRDEHVAAPESKAARQNGDSFGHAAVNFQF